jgi:hypothetical protein
MSASRTTAPHTDPLGDAGYAWFLENRTELFDFIRLHDLELLELQLNLPEGTALRFKALYDTAASVSEYDEILYATTWDAYHEALDEDHNLSIIASAYSQSHPLPLHEMIDATGTLTF